MSARRDEPLAADRRTLVISAAAMVVLVLVGVVSAAVFTRSACEAIVPEPVEARTAGADLVAVLQDAFPDAEADEVDDITTAVTALAGSLGPMTAVAAVDGADRLAVIDSDAGVIAATGSTTTVLDDWGATATARAQFGDATIVGSGGALFALALVNQLTGQVDAVRPLDVDLEPGACTDTAVVAEPFAFHLDAAGGELLLFRVEDDADDPELELFGGDAATWVADLDVGVAPPGLLGERLDGRLGEELAVVGRHSAPEEDNPLLAAFERETGAERWTLGRDDLGSVLSSDRADVVRVEAVGTEVVVASVTPEPVGEDAGGDVAVSTYVVTLDARTGEVSAADELPPGWGLRDVAVDGDVVLLASAADDETRVQRLRDRGLGDAATIPGDGRRLDLLPGGDPIVLSDRSVSLLGDSDDEVIRVAPLVGRDLVVHAGGTTFLLGGPGDGAVAITFGR